MMNSDISFSLANGSTWQRITENMIRSRRKLVYELVGIATRLDLSARSTATIDYNDKQGMEAVEAMRLLGQMQAEDSASSLISYLLVRAPVIPSKPATFLGMYPAAEALANIGLSSLNYLLTPDPTLVIEKNDPQLETRLTGAIIEQVLGRVVGITYTQERLKLAQETTTHTRLKRIITHLERHTREEIQRGR